MKKQSKLEENETILYVGTTEKIAKEAPLKGLQPPVVLSDVYPGYFALLESQKEKQRWGIIAISVEALMPDNFAPWKKGLTWEESLKQRGVCLYTLHVPPIAIAKIMIYNPWMYGNQFVNEAVAGMNPTTTTLAKHQSNYILNQGLTRWLACEAVTGDDLVNGNGSFRQRSEYHQLLQNRSGLELFYRRTQDHHAWWKPQI